MQIQRQSQVQQQQLKMNPQLYQSIKLMELPIFDLRERIEQEIEQNPALEIIEDKSTIPLDESETRQNERYEYFETTSDPGRRTSPQASEEHRRFIEGVLTRPETLQEHLLWQLQLEPIDDELKLIAETLIQNLDDDGFHKEKPETLFPDASQNASQDALQNALQDTSQDAHQATKFPAQPRLEEAMKLVRSLEPAGTCTSDYRESLEVQIELTPDAPSGTEKILDHLELLDREKYTVLAKKTGMDENYVRLLCEFIKKLSPFPGRSFAPADVRFVIPDIRVVRDKKEFSIILNDEAFPVLGINSFFEELGDSKEIDARGTYSAASSSDSARDFAREKTKEARLFINHLNRRNQTLIRVANAVLEFQRSFFINGPKYLAPLTLGDIAKELNIHETTVSRTANGKYMQTEWGIFEIRHFFTNSISGAGSGGSRFSKESVKEIIKEIITSENRLLSDQDISALLSKKGIALARRTVAKYRKELDMGSSYTRKTGR